MLDKPPRRIVFVGPSLSLDKAKQILSEAEFRGPIKRGDLNDIAPGTVVGIIDGLFDQNLAISPGEIREAISQGSTIYGAASMGALRAAEIPDVIGVGRIFEMYRTGVIERDDEVAVLINPQTLEPLTEALVNVRFSVERLVRSGTLNRNDGNEIIETGARLHYTERSYRNILSQSKLAANKDVDDIIQLLKTFNLKRDDAELLLETLATSKITLKSSSSKPKNPNLHHSTGAHKRVNIREHSTAPILVWESGDLVQFSELIRFLKVTGKFEDFARNAISRMLIDSISIESLSHVEADHRDQEINAAQMLLDSVRAQWGWESPEEAHVTMLDLGLGLDDVADSLEGEGKIRQLIKSFGVAPSEEFSKALRIELWSNELSLKRETLRLGALKFFAREGSEMGSPTDIEIQDARRCVARLRGVFRWGTVVSTLTAIGISPKELDEVVQDIVFARRVIRPIIDAMKQSVVKLASTPRSVNWQALNIGFESSLKANNSARFSLNEAEASAKAELIAKQMGIVRIGLVGELDNLGIYIAQAFGERSGWSSSFSSGKSETRDGARVGSIMEEVEIYAQDAYTPKQIIHTSYAESSETVPLVHPCELGLPYDSRYTDSLEIDWSPCLDLVSCRTVFVPTACLLGNRQNQDILYCPRLGGKIFSSSGLGSGFSLAEAIVHAGAEYIERHAYRLAELQLDNPGGVGAREFKFVDEQSLPETPARIVAKYRQAGMCVRILDITSDVAVPTFYTRVYDDLFKSDRSVSADGFACHPDPEVAVTMALLESAQTRGGYIAGGREDYSLHARSLGRHERPRTAVPRSQIFWFSNDRPIKSFNEISGFLTKDILNELEWIVDRVVDAGFPMFLVADYTIPNISPAHAVRVLIPGLETTNPLFTGRRARATLIHDFVPYSNYGE